VKNIDATALLGDEEAEKILLATYISPKSGIEISEIYRIPIAHCFRKIRELERLGLLRCVRTEIGPNGRKKRYYKSNLENAYVTVEDGKFKVRLELALTMAEDIRRRFAVMEAKTRASR